MKPQDSPNYIEDVCNQIPQTLDDENLEAIGYQQGCYQTRTKTWERLKCSIAPNDKASTTLFPGK